MLGLRAIFGSSPPPSLAVSALALLAGVGCDSTPVVVPDADQDGFPADQDCDDADADAFPGALEVCDGADNDCDGAVDVGAVDADPFWPDSDDDTFGDDAAEPVLACIAPEGAFVERAGDCDDSASDVYPGRVELCNGVDDDCSGVVDDTPNELWYPDLDGDGFGDAEAVVATCDPDPTLIAVGGDCDDARADVFEGADELCDGVDNDCDELVDDEDTDRIDPPAWFPDVDEDGFGSQAFSVEQCDPPAGSWSPSDDDCDDFVETTFPGALELCNGVDDDCDGTADTPDAPGVAGVAAGIELSSAVALDQPVFVVPIDLQATYEAAGGTGPVDPDALQVFVGECATGQMALPVRFLDAWSGTRFEDLQPDPDGDAVGALVVSWDPDPASPVDPGAVDVFDGPVVTGALHFAPGNTVGSASASGAQLASGAVTLELSDGGHLVEWAGVDGAIPLDQADFQPRIDTPAGTVFLAGGTPVVDAHPAISGVRVEGVVGNSVASVSFEAQWWVASGSTTAVGHLQLTTEGDTTLVGSESWQSGVVSMAAGDASGMLDVGADRATLQDASAGVLALVAPGAFVSGAPIGGIEWAEIRGTDAAGPADTPLYTVPAGVPLVETSAVWAAPGADVADTFDDLAVAPVLEVDGSGGVP